MTMSSKPTFRHFLALALLVTSSGAWAQDSARSLRASGGDAICTAKVLRSGGYRDLAVRFGARPPLDAGARAARDESAYRDWARRTSSAPLRYANASRTPPRYSLLASPSCG
jgi:hypothetical protein